MKGNQRSHDSAPAVKFKAEKGAWILLLAVIAIAISVLQPPQTEASESAVSSSFPGVQFTDVTRKSNINFRHENPPTAQKYLLETMGGGIALFDYDNDGKLDTFFTNGQS